MAFWSFAHENLKSKGVDRAAAEAFRDGRFHEVPPLLLAALKESPLRDSQLQDFIDDVDS